MILLISFFFIIIARSYQHRVFRQLYYRDFYYYENDSKVFFY